MAGDEVEATSDAEAQLAAYAVALADGIDAALPGWVTASVARICTAYYGTVPEAVGAAAEEAADRAQREIAPAVRGLLATDPDQQSTTPLALVRGAVRYPTEVLRGAGVPPVQRDAFTERAFPADLYDLSPAALADLDPALADPGLAWGAAKAFVHRRRHRTP